MADPNVVPVEPQPPSGPLHSEPVLTLTTVYAIVAAVCLALAAWGINVSDEKRHAIEGLIGVLFPLIASLHIRSIVWSPKSVRKVEKAAKAAGAAGK